jgi:uncharacterized protein (DUF58 family)
MAESRGFDNVLSPRAKELLRHLEFLARRKVEGLLHGAHRSRRIGVSTDFDHHKFYTPGDPIKHIDWKASVRHDRTYVKRYTEDTAMTVRLVVDRSASMLFATEDGPSKYLQACRITAALAYMILKGNDPVSLVMAAADGNSVWLPPSSTASQLIRILRALAENEATAGDELSTCLRTITDRGERKGVVIVVSDLMFDPQPVQRELGKLSAQGHEVLLFQLRDQTEEEFAFNRWVQFGSLEDAGVSHRIDTIPLKRIYLEEYRLLRDEWEQWARKYNVHFNSMRSDEDVDTALSDYLAHRARQE